jgi:TonB family protein
MSKVRHFLSLLAITGLVILAGGVGIWALPLRASPQATTVTRPAEKENPPTTFVVIQPITQTPVVYPLAAKKAGIHGKVRLRVSINKDGSVMDVKVLSGEPQLVKASLEAVQQWRYAPSNELRVTVVTLNFGSTRGRAPAPASTPTVVPPWNANLP